MMHLRTHKEMESLKATASFSSIQNRSCLQKVKMFSIISALILTILTKNTVVGDNFSIALLQSYNVPVDFKTQSNLLTKRLGLNHSNLDLIVFPKGRFLNSTNNNITLNDNPCASFNSSNYGEDLRKLSCTANSSKVYLILPGEEKDYILNDNGTIVLVRSHKINNTLQQPDGVNFTINGRNFGVISSFDLLFSEPSENLIKNEKITHFIYTGSNLNLGLPFLTDVQVQQMWAQSHDVSLYTAGVESGVIIGGTRPVQNDRHTELGAYLYNFGNSSAHYANFCKIDYKRVIKPGTMSMESASKPLNTSTSNEHTVTVCYNETTTSNFCCDFKVKTNNITSNINYTYQMVAFIGNQSYNRMENHQIGVEICAILACRNDSITSCGEVIPTDPSFQFEKLEIRANFIKGWKTQYPNSLQDDPSTQYQYRPLEPSQTVWNQTHKSGFIETTFSLKEPTKRILTFAIFGRNFDKDYPQQKRPLYVPLDGKSPNLLNNSRRNQSNWFVIILIACNYIMMYSRA